MKKKKPEPMRAPRMLEAVVKAPGLKPRVTMIVGTETAISSIVGEIISRERRADGNMAFTGDRGTCVVVGYDAARMLRVDVKNPKAVCLELGDPIERA